MNQDLGDVAGADIADQFWKTGPLRGQLLNSSDA